jgi:RNA polymerase sigma-70 factor (ECF subfamily)
MPRPELALQTPFVDDPAKSERLAGLVRLHFTFVWRSLRRLGLEQAEADDAAQSVLLLLARRLQEVEPGKERAFLFASALRIARARRRQGSRRRERFEQTEPDELAHPEPSPEGLLERRRARQLLDGIVAELPLELGAVLILHEIEELSVGEIAQTLALPEGTVASRLRRARHKFEQQVRRLEAKLHFTGETP